MKEDAERELSPSLAQQGHETSNASSVYWDARDGRSLDLSELQEAPPLDEVGKAAAPAAGYGHLAGAPLTIDTTEELASVNETLATETGEEGYDAEVHDRYVEQMSNWCMIFCCQCSGACCGCLSTAETRRQRREMRRKTLERQAVLIGEMLSAYDFRDGTPSNSRPQTPSAPVRQSSLRTPRRKPQQPDEVAVRQALLQKIGMLFERSPRAGRDARQYPVLLPQDWLRGIELYITLGAFADEPMRLQRLCMQLPPVPTIDLQRLHHWMRFAAAPLGQYLLILERPFSAMMNYPKAVGHAVSTRSTPSSGLLAVARRCRVSPDRILLARLRAKTYRPAFVVVEDPITDSFVVTIRGTMSVSDCFTDLEGMPERFEVHCCAGSPAGEGTVISGTAHGGMLRSGINLCRRVLPTLQHACERRGGQPRIVVTGHSLGGGAATTLAILLQAHLPNVRGVCFAPPPSVSIEAAEACDSLIDSVARGNDSVPRMSLPAMAHFLRIAYLGKLRLNAFQRAALLIRCGGACTYPPELYEEVQRVTYSLENRRMFLAGRVYYITEPPERSRCDGDRACGFWHLLGRCGRSSSSSGATKDEESEALLHRQLIRVIDRRELRCLIGRKGILEHHMPWGYEQALLSLLREEKAPSLRRQEIEARQRLQFGRAEDRREMSS